MYARTLAPGKAMRREDARKHPAEGMHMRRTWISAPVALLISLPLMLGLASQQAVPPVAEEKQEQIRPYVTWSGPKSRAVEKAYLLIRSGEEWSKIWRGHAGEPRHKPVVHGTGMPEVNFDTCIAIAVFCGRAKNSDGVKFVSIEEVSGRLRVRFDNKTYQTSGPDGGGNKVTPYGVIVLPKTSLPVDLEEKTQSLKGKPPIWIRRASFPSSK